MQDPRLVMMRSIEQIALSMLPPEKTREMIDKITIVINDYEITERCTDIVPLDDTNIKLEKRYAACLMIEGKSEKTAYQYRRTIRKLSEFLNKPYTEMGTYDIRFFLASEKERGASERYLENIRANISAFFTWLTVEDLIPKNPMAAIKPITYHDELRREFSEVEIDKLRFACKTDKERAIIEFLLASGVRVPELSSMEVKDVDFQTLRVHVIHGKGSKERYTYITSVAFERLKRYIDNRPKIDDKYLFYNHKHERLQPGGIRHILNEIAKRADVSNVHPHRFRRTFATKLAKRGMDIQLIKELLGHSNLDTTMEYVNTNDDDIKSSYKKYIA